MVLHLGHNLITSVNFFSFVYILLTKRSKKIKTPLSPGRVTFLGRKSFSKQFFMNTSTLVAKVFPLLKISFQLFFHAGCFLHSMIQKKIILE